MVISIKKTKKNEIKNHGSKFSNSLTWNFKRRSVKIYKRVCMNIHNNATPGARADHNISDK